ncbi:MAG: DUF2177 family protein [Candidatus Pacebacteria bacterium]|nr:DUF2177 family protein [Candidatus Paceibacterota bacterium]
MKNILISLVSALVSMLAIDAVWLSTMAKTFYSKHIGHLMAESPNLLPAGIFYLIYTFALSVLVVVPAIHNGSSTLRVFLLGALFGFTAYATYDLTNQATLKSWPTVVTVVDMAWGAALTGVTAVIAFYLTKYFA